MRILELCFGETSRSVRCAHREEERGLVVLGLEVGVRALAREHRDHVHPGGVHRLHEGGVTVLVL
eukprot:5790570-Pyramimonas_sp.AAC.1